MSHSRGRQLKIRCSGEELERILRVIESKTFLCARIPRRRRQIARPIRALKNIFTLKLRLEPSEQFLQARNGLLRIIRSRRIDLGPLDGLLDLMDSLLQAFSLATKVNLHAPVLGKYTYFFTPFCLPRW